MIRFRPATLAGVLVVCLALTVSAQAQLNKVFGNIFTEVLVTRLQLSPGKHSSHFLEAAQRADLDLVPALNSLIAGNVSSFPLSSTSTGVSFDFSSGLPVRVSESLGPIFAETAKPLGQGKFLMEANYTYLDLSRFRGLPTDRMRFTFTHVDVTGDGTLGQSPNESDLMDLDLDLHARAGIGVLFATYGVTNALDVSVALPIVTMSLKGTATATINSFTFPRLGHANHMFGPDTLNPILTTQVPYDQQSTGLGDLALRVKYCFSRGGSLEAAALLDARFPTGKTENFLGSGKATVRLWGILSKHFGDLGTHVNLGYARKAASLQSDAIEYRLGFDTKLQGALTFALDLLGQFDLNASEAIHLAPGSVTIVDLVPGGRSVRTIPLSNIPDRSNDNTTSLSFGLRVAPSDNSILFANALVPLNDGGLRAPIAPTVGFSIMF